MQVQTTIEQKLAAGLQPAVLQVINESGMHNVPAGSESHFKVVAVSDVFVDLGLVQRHRQINGLLADELAGPVHALSLQAFTPEEWVARGGQFDASPDCLGGSSAG